MRDLVFKNLTSIEKRRKVISSSEVTDNNGIHSVINRHFMYMVREVACGSEMPKPEPHVHVIKDRNTKDQRESFFCKIKGGVYVMHEEKVFLVNYMHTLRIQLTSATQRA